MKTFVKPAMFVAVAGLALYQTGSYVMKNVERPKITEVFVFDLKKGRASLIRTSQDIRILIGAEYDDEVLREISKILPFYSRTIHHVINTDIETDCSGVIAILERYDVGKLYIAKYGVETYLGSQASSSIMSDVMKESLLAVAEARGAEVLPLERGMKIDTGSGSFIEVLFPAKPEEFKYSKSSPPQIVVSFNASSTRYIFLEKASAKIARYVARNESDIQDVEKPHETALIYHSSPSPTNLPIQFMEAINPKFVVYARSRALSAKSPVVADSEKDPLKNISFMNKINIKNEGGARLVSNGAEISLTR